MKDPSTKAGRSGNRTSPAALFAGMYHELSNPLANIRLAAEVLLEDLEESQREGLPDTEYVEFKLTGIVREVDRAAALLRELSHLSRVDGFETEWTSLKGLLERAWVSSRQRIPPGVRVKISGGEDICVKCDEQMLLTAFMNLISDAAAAVGDHGEVSLESRRDSRDTVEIAVTNTGESLLDQIDDAIFEPFSSTRRAGRGKGLGLFVPSEIIKSHNGSIRIESISGRGTAIMLRLPAGRAELVPREFPEPGEQ
ncbi:MAG: HAMP domain-containing sensor histidine kinase [Pseudomonadota bacterium]